MNSSRVLLVYVRRLKDLPMLSLESVLSVLTLEGHAANESIYFLAGAGELSYC